MGLKKGIVIDLIMLGALAIVGFTYLSFEGNKFLEGATQKPTPAAAKMQPNDVIQPQKTSLANPASVYCGQVGGKLVIQKRGDGGEYGLCQFADNQACEEWALYRKECPIGGFKTTGYDTIAQKYCAWLGGKTFAAPNADCTLPNGNICDDEALYNGTCNK